MKKLLFAFAASALLASCQIEPPVSELFFLLDNRSSYDIEVILKPDKDTYLVNFPDKTFLSQISQNSLGTICRVLVEGGYINPLEYIDSLRLYRISKNAEKVLVYEQNEPISPTHWKIEHPQEYRSKSTLIFTDDMIQR